MSQAVKTLMGHIDPMVGALADEGLPIGIATTPPKGEADRLRPVLWIGEVGGGRATVIRTPHASEGENAPSCALNADQIAGGRAPAKLGAWLGELADLLREDIRIAAEGHDPMSPPARYHRAHPLLIAALAQWGWDPEEVVRPAVIHGSDGPVTVRMDKGICTSVLSTARSDHRAATVRTLFRRRVFVDSLRVTMNGSPTEEGRTWHAGEKRIWFSDLGRRPVVSVAPADLPESAQAAAPGLRVGDLVDGPGTEIFAPFRIVRCWTTQTGDPTTHMEIEAGEAMLA